MVNKTNNSKPNYNVAIDGDSASGKSSVSKEVARRLKLFYVSSGSIYRLMAFIVKTEFGTVDDSFVLQNQAKIEKLFERIEMVLKPDGTFGILDRPVPSLTNEEFATYAANLSSHNFIRTISNKYLFKVANEKTGIIMEGRDIGTVIMPRAKYKFFFETSSEIKAERRTKQLNEKGIAANFEQVKAGIDKRDQLVKSRQIAPLAKAYDSVVIDNSDLSFDMVVEFIISHIMAQEARDQD